MSKTTVSIIIPCLNEEAYIGKVLDNILQQDYPLTEMEVFVCDGGSTDNTRQIVQQYELEHAFIQLLPNPDKFVPHAINRALKVAQGDFMFLFGAHTLYPNNYISKLKTSAEVLDADLVGGALETKPRDESTTAQGIAEVLSHPMGVGNATFRTGVKKVTAVDTVPFGCYRMSVFEKYGLFDERLIRNQDMEMSKRILNGGGKIFLVPGVKSIYYGRATLADLWTNNFGNGKWVLLTAKFTNSLKSLSVRHFVPLFFALYLLSLLPAYFLMCEILIVFYTLPFLIYFAIILLASWYISFERKRWSLMISTFLAFITLHLSYGFGSAVGLFSVLSSLSATQANSKKNNR